MYRVPLRLLADAVLVAAVLFLAAGTLAWWRAWVLVAVLLVVRAIGSWIAGRRNPALLRERASFPVHSGQPVADRFLLFAVLGTGFLGVPLMAGLDAFRWHLLTPPPRVVGALGLALFALGWSLKSAALVANAFATSEVRLQGERGHEVVDSGPYAVVRHPFYAADPWILAGMGLWLQSYLAALCAVLPVALMVARLRGEERFLLRALPGYDAYVRRVRYRLLPGVW